MVQRNPVPDVSVDISANVCGCVRRSLDNQLCVLVILDLANSASRVALSVSLERDSHRAPPLERVISLSVPQTITPAALQLRKLERLILPHDPLSER